MTAQEYIQLKAFARVDGLKMAVAWVGSFACYMASIRQPGLGLVALVLVVITPILAWRLLKNYRNQVLEGFISFLRAWGYVVLIFFYAGILLALAQFLYFTYWDHGAFFAQLNSLMAEPQTARMLESMGMADTVAESIRQISAMRPIDLALNMLTSNIMLGMLVALPVAALIKRQRIVKS